MANGSIGALFPTVGISTTASSKSVAIPVGASKCHVTNTSSSLFVYVAFGIGSATAVIPTADNGAAGSMCYVLPPYESMTVDVPKGSNFVASIGSGAGPSLVYFTLVG